MRYLQMLCLLMAIFCASVSQAQTFKCIDISFNSGDAHSIDERLDIKDALLGHKAIVTPLDDRILLEMFDGEGKRDSSFVCYKYDNGLTKGYKYMLPKTLGVVVIEEKYIFPSISNIQKFRVEVWDAGNGYHMNVYYVRSSNF